MSTRSLIFVKIKPEDRRKQIFYSPSDMTAGIKFENENELTKWSKENEIFLKGKYIRIYCHSDGYVSGVGQTLVSFFNDYEKALNLMSAGSVCYIDKISASFMDTPPDVFENIIVPDPLFIEYVYLFDNGIWYVRNTNKESHKKMVTYTIEDFVPVTEYLKNHSNG